MDIDQPRAQQIAHEQLAIDAMYDRLDAERSETLATRARTLASGVDEPEMRVARDAELSRLDARLQRRRLAERSLCFGRIDMSGDAAPLHIGRVGLQSAGGTTLLVDWRAEAARPFYEATTKSPLGVRRRRHLRLNSRSVVDVTDEILDGSSQTENDIVGDAPLTAALTGARSGRMHDAAATLQTEQDEIVRSQHRGIIVVDGGPGTGKTIVALHRAAYVLYAFPAIADRGVLIFGPNARFLSYISDVLPSLGENDVAMATAADLIAVQPGRLESDGVARAKGRGSCAAELARFVQARQPRGRSLRVHTEHGTVVVEPDRVDDARRRALQGGAGHNPARESFIEYLVDDVVTELERQTVQEISDFEAEIKEAFGIDLDRMFASDSPDAADSSGFDEIDWDRIRDELLDDAGIRACVDRVWPLLHPDTVLQSILRDGAVLRHLLPELSDDAIHAVTSAAESGWTVADLALLDELHMLLDGPPETVYGHIVVDEAQQLSEMQWRMLMRRCPNRSMTIVGDLAQAGPSTTITTWADALHPFVSDRFAHYTLTINYRTTAEILDATAPLLRRIAPGQRLSRSLRHGDQPIIVTASDHTVDATIGTLIAELRRDHPGELIGIIASSRRAAGLGADGRETHPRDTNAQQPSRLGSDVMVVPAAEARGLEFDTVLVVAPDEIESASAAGLRDLYVAQTRATKRLFTVARTQ
ncbi:HelD family protein [Gordonia aichiensis]|uniref:HelD family protein n=1 Tax=Gordonia aichiensis TaxID=36820 RepID=UPI00034AC73D|nr:AAA family ATPase [Gordonia aichiensis]